MCHGLHCPALSSGGDGHPDPEAALQALGATCHPQDCRTEIIEFEMTCQIGS